jgi:hypothetical protein
MPGRKLNKFFYFSCNPVLSGIRHHILDIQTRCNPDSTVPICQYRGPLNAAAAVFELAYRRVIAIGIFRRKKIELLSGYLLISVVNKFNASFTRISVLLIISLSFQEFKFANSLFK